jgi:hypothetical protein
MPVSLAVALGGAIGSLGRYGLDRLIERRSLSLFPWATFTVNATGCLLIGVVLYALASVGLGVLACSPACASSATCKPKGCGHPFGIRPLRFGTWRPRPGSDPCSSGRDA